MAETVVEAVEALKEPELKRIAFVKDAVKSAEPYYAGVKERSGPLKVREDDGEGPAPGGATRSSRTAGDHSELTQSPQRARPTPRATTGPVRVGREGDRAVRREVRALHPRDGGRTGARRARRRGSTACSSAPRASDERAPCALPRGTR